ncbi:MAG: hypothetical protein MHMPM18_002166 [Marteilia pararefringens]
MEDADDLADTVHTIEQSVKKTGPQFKFSSIELGYRPLPTPGQPESESSPTFNMMQALNDLVPSELSPTSSPNSNYKPSLAANRIDLHRQPHLTTPQNHPQTENVVIQSPRPQITTLSNFAASHYLSHRAKKSHSGVRDKIMRLFPKWNYYQQAGFAGIGSPTSSAAAHCPQTRCTICLVEYESNCSMCTLPCMHYFHGSCISRWLRANKKCPTCRVSVDFGV